MKNILKQFAVWAISFKNKPFLHARLKLTVYYTLGIFVILIIFNLAVYVLFVKDIPDYPYDEETNQAEDRLENVLYTVDSLVIILVAGLSYYLAGQTLKPIEVTYKRQKKFIADSAHELRTPLAVMKTGAETALNCMDSKDDYRKIIRDLLEEVNYLSDMVNDLLFLAHSDGMKKNEFTKFDLGSLVTKQVELMQPFAKNKDIVLKTDIKDEFFIEGSKANIKRLLVNLIKNAIDYNIPKGEVVISLQKNKKQVELKITDTGIGIAKDDLKHIFNRFYKADQARTKQSSGVGLGLSIVQEIVQSHKGQIKVESTINQGTVVRILFPIL